MVRSKKSQPKARRGKVQGRAPISIDDVIVALVDLLDKLEITPRQIASRVKSSEKGASPVGKQYSHNATIGELLTAWHRKPEYLNDDGTPRPIRMRGRYSFVTLARESVPSMDPFSLLTQLEAIGAVASDADGNIHVVMRSLSVYADRKLAAHYTLSSLHNYIKTLSHNLDSQVTNADQLFHRIAWNDAFSRALIPALKIKLRRQGQNPLESCDNWMLRKQRAGRGGRKTAQVSIGVYLAINDDVSDGAHSRPGTLASNLNSKRLEDLRRPRRK